ncbi:thrombin inhibitor hemalin [Aplochiton taeniatus]
MKHLIVFGVAFAAFYMVNSQLAEFCKLPQDTGTGTGGEVDVLLYYDAAKDICYPFRYTGEGGNDNRFANERECMRNCSTRAEEVYPIDEIKSCHFAKAPGLCFGTYLRFYYDPIHKVCHSFFWTGCVGNGNRYLDIQSCNATCAGIHEEGDSEEDVESDTPIALIFGIVFGIIGAGIIIGVIVLSIKST